MKSYEERVNVLYDYFKSSYDKDEFREFRELCDKPDFSDEELLEAIEEQDECFVDFQAMVLGCLSKHMNSLVECSQCPLATKCGKLSQNVKTRGSFLDGEMLFENVEDRQLSKTTFSIQIEDKEYTKDELLKEVAMRICNLEDGVYANTPDDYDDFYTSYSFKKV